MVLPLIYTETHNLHNCTQRKPRHHRYPENNPKELQKLHRMNCVTEKPYLSIFQHKLSFSLLLSNCHLLSAVYYCRHFYLVNYHQKNQCCNVNHDWRNELIDAVHTHFIQDCSQVPKMPLQRRLIESYKFQHIFNRKCIKQEAHVSA